MSKFGEYIESWKEQEKLLHEKLSLLKEDVWRKLPEVSGKLKSLGAREVIIFGSLVEEDFRSDSDIDIAVEGLPGNKYIEAIIETEKILAPVRIDFDLVLYEKVHPWIKEKIERGKRL